MMQVAANERGYVRLFAVDLPRREIEVFKTHDQDGEADKWPLRDALGASFLDEDYIECFDVGDLEGLGLSRYMVEGLGVSQKDVAEDAVQLNAVKGFVVVALSPAFCGIAQRLHPREPLRWLGTFAEEKELVQYRPIPSEAAQGQIHGDVKPAPKPVNPHLTLIVALLALPMLAPHSRAGNLGAGMTVTETAEMNKTAPLAVFRADRATYLRANAWMAAFAMALGMIVLALMGNPHIWTGAVGGLAAVAVRAFYLQSEELGWTWELYSDHIAGPGGRTIPLSDIAQVNTITHSVQLVTRDGQKYLIKFQANREETAREIRGAIR